MPKLVTMTSYIPALTLPAVVFSTPASAILLPVTLGTAVGFSLSPSKTQNTYMKLKQPPYRPPPYVFGPAWTVFYGLMGYSSWRAYNALSPLESPANIQRLKHGFTLYTIQLGLNLIWTPLFFRLKRPIEATVDVVALTGIVGYLTYVWGSVDAVAGWALAPYLGWLCFASYLSAGVGYLNDWSMEDKVVPRSPATKGRDDLYANDEKR